MNTDLLSSGLQEALGRSPQFIELQEKVGAIAPVNRPVLLTGERGTGKELAAARLHYLSKRWSGPFIRWNCAASPADLVESELFGHEAGAFTGALKRRPGRFEMSHGGTLFLDELGQMPAPVQEKLLRVIEYGVFERVGGNESLQVDVRIVAATNEDLGRACADGGTVSRGPAGSHRLLRGAGAVTEGAAGGYPASGAILHRANGGGDGAEYNARA